MTSNQDGNGTPQNRGANTSSRNPRAAFDNDEQSFVSALSLMPLTANSPTPNPYKANTTDTRISSPSPAAGASMPVAEPKERTNNTSSLASSANKTNATEPPMSSGTKNRQVIVIDDDDVTPGGSRGTATDKQTQKKKSAPKNIADERVHSVVATLIEPQLKTLTNKVIDLSMSMIAENKTVRGREKALKAWANREINDPYIPKSANVNTTLTTSAALQGDATATGLQDMFENIKQEFKKKASNCIFEMANLELAQAKKNRFKVFIELSLSTTVTCVLLAIKLEGAAEPEERSVEQLAAIVLLRCMEQELDEDFFPTYLDIDLNSAKNDALPYLETNAEKHASLLLSELSPAERTIQTMALGRMRKFLNPVTRGLQFELNGATLLREAEASCAMREKKRRRQAATDATAAGLAAIPAATETDMKGWVTKEVTNQLPAVTKALKKRKGKNGKGGLKTNFTSKKNGKPSGGGNEKTAKPPPNGPTTDGSMHSGTNKGKRQRGSRGGSNKGTNNENGKGKKQQKRQKK